MRPRPLVSSSRGVRVLLVNDQELVRAGLRALLVGQEEILVVGEAATAEGALATCCLIHPNVLLVDTMLPALAAFTLIRNVRERYPKIGVIALTEGLAPCCGAPHPQTPPLTPGVTASVPS